MAITPQSLFAGQQDQLDPKFVAALQQMAMQRQGGQPPQNQSSFQAQPQQGALNPAQQQHPMQAPAAPQSPMSLLQSPAAQGQMVGRPGQSVTQSPLQVSPQMGAAPAGGGQLGGQAPLGNPLAINPVGQPKPWAYNANAQYAQHDQAMQQIDALHQAAMSPAGQQFQKGINTVNWNDVGDSINKYNANVKNSNPDMGYIANHGVQAATVIGANGGSAYDIAASMLGKQEGNDHSTLSSFFKSSGMGSVDPRSTPWCAAFANSVFQASGIQGTHSLAARSFLGFGTPEKQADANKGDVVVFSDLSGNNNPNHGHVGLIDHFSDDGKTVFVLGGNQHNSVSIRSFPTSKVIGYRQPPTGQEVKAKTQEMQQNGGIKLAGDPQSKLAPTPGTEIEPGSETPEQHTANVTALDQGLSYE